MGDFVQTIINFIVAIGQLVKNIVTGTGQMLLMIPKSATFLTYVLAYLPAVVSVFCIALIGINVVYLIIGR